MLATPLAWAQDQSPSGGWFDRPMRWAQVAFTEDDPGNYDLGMWLRYFKRIHADAACLSAGGCVAFYPTKVPYHYRSKYLGQRSAAAAVWQPRPGGIRVEVPGVEVYEVIAVT